MSEARTFGSCQVVYDDRYEPLLITHWRGAATLAAAQWATEMQRLSLEGAQRRSERFITISDASLAKRPPPEVRKFWADAVAEQMPIYREVVISNSVVIQSPLMRGAMTAIGWLSEDVRSIGSFPTLEAALQSALDELHVHGIAPPRGLDPARYRSPAD